MDLDRNTDTRVRDWLHEGPDDLPEAVLREIIARTDTTPQARRRSLGRWFERDGGARRRTDEHDHPPHPDTRRTKLMFSATGLVAAFAVLALTVNVVTTQTEAPQVGSGATHVVAADGSGDFSTITEAVAAAEDGDTVMIRPGTYDEAIDIDQDITLMGDGSREDIVIASEAGPLIDLDGSNATLAGFTLSGATTFVNVEGGEPTLEDLWFRAVGTPDDGGASGPVSLRITGGSTALVRHNLFTEGGEIVVTGDAAPLIDDNELRDGPSIFLFGSADGTVVRNNTIIDNHDVGIAVLGRGRPLIEGNVLDGSRTTGFDIGMGDGNGVDPILRGNVVTRAPIGLTIGRSAAPTVEENEIDVEGIAIVFGGPSEAAFSGNHICGAEAIVATRSADQASPALAGNEVCEVATVG